MIFVSGKARPGDWPQVPDERRAPQLEQGLHQDQGAAEGEGDRLLLRQPLPRQGPQAEVRRIRPHLQEGGLLRERVFNLLVFFYIAFTEEEKFPLYCSQVCQNPVFIYSIQYIYIYYLFIS